MPEALANLSPAALAGVLVAYLLAASRVAGPLKPLLTKLPEPWARIAPVIVALLPQVADLFSDVNTWQSFLVSVSSAVALALPGLMKDPPPPPGDSRPVAAKPSEPHVFLQNEDGSPIEMRSWPVPAWGVLAVLACLVGCPGNAPPPKAPCDPTTLAAMTAACSAEAYAGGKNGGTEAECTAECDRKLDKRAEECR